MYDEECRKLCVGDDDDDESSDEGAYQSAREDFEDAESISTIEHPNRNKQKIAQPNLSSLSFAPVAQGAVPPPLSLRQSPRASSAGGSRKTRSECDELDGADEKDGVDGAS